MPLFTQFDPLHGLSLFVDALTPVQPEYVDASTNSVIFNSAILPVHFNCRSSSFSFITPLSEFHLYVPPTFQEWLSIYWSNTIAGCQLFVGLFVFEFKYWFNVESLPTFPDGPFVSVVESS